RSPTDRSGRARRARLERTIARARQMDQRLRLLPNRSGDAQFAAASDSACRNRVEEAIVRATHAQDRQGGNREIAAARSTPGGTAGGDLAIGSAGARSRSSAPD